MLRRLDTRIVVLFLSLLLLVQLASFAFIREYIGRSAQHAIAAELATGEKVWRRLLEQKAERLGEAARLLAADFGFRDAIATSDAATISDALANQAGRIGASEALFADPRLTLKAATGESAAQLLPLLEPLRAGARGTAAVQVALVGSRPHLVVAVPVRAPAMIGWIAMAFPIGQELLDDLRNLTAVEASLLVNDPQAGRGWQLELSALPAAGVIELARHPPDDDAGYRELTLSGIRYGTLQTALARRGGEGGLVQARVVLMRSVGEVTAPYRQLQLILLALTAAGAALFAAGSWLTARKVTRPLEQLASSAERLGGGDYETPVEVAGTVEIGQLAQRFETMRVEVRERDRRISRLAFWDELTGLPNRAQFVELIDQAIAGAGAGPVSVLMLDLNRFKQVNDVLGRAFGDRLLRLIAQRLRGAALRDEDIIARLGGDEFAVLLPGADETAAERAAQRVRASLERPVCLDDQTVDIDAGVGVACRPAHGDDAATLLSRAEAAMYAAKTRQTGVTVFEASLDAGSARSLSLLSEIRRAIDSGELELHLQPKASLAGGRASGAEALVRWRHPERGMIPPGEFIPFLEQTGSIRVVTAFVLQRAAQCWLELNARGRPMPVAVNLSARDLMDQDFPAKLERLLAGYRLPPGALTLEITESATMDDPQRALLTLQKLHQLGLSLSIDDFGTGYSSLAYLGRLPVSQLKIDRSFVTNMEHDGRDAQIVRSTIDLAHNLGLTVVAEGVESARAWALLRQWRCDDAQGYLIGRPMPLAALLVWMEEWQAPGAQGESNDRGAGPPPRLPLPIKTGMAVASAPPDRPDTGASARRTSWNGDLDSCQASCCDTRWQRCC